MRFRAPADDELAALRRCVAATAAPIGFAARGKAHFESPDGAVDGEIEVRVAPPDRAWLQLRTRALFSLVGARFVTALPGDGFLVTYSERGDDLQRLPFANSLVAALAPGGEPGTLLDIATGRLAWAGGGPDSLAGRARIGESGGQRFYVIATGLPGPPGSLRIWLNGDNLQRLQWWVGSELRFEVEYGRYVPVGSRLLPSRLQVRAPQARLRARVELEPPLPRAEFAPADFEVGRVGNPPRDRGVSDG